MTNIFKGIAIKLKKIYSKSANNCEVNIKNAKLLSKKINKLSLELEGMKRRFIDSRTNSLPSKKNGRFFSSSKKDHVFTNLSEHIKKFRILREKLFSAELGEQIFKNTSPKIKKSLVKILECNKKINQTLVSYFQSELKEQQQSLSILGTELKDIGLKLITENREKYENIRLTDIMKKHNFSTYKSGKENINPLSGLKKRRQLFKSILNKKDFATYL